MHAQKWLRNFDKFWTSKRAKNTQKVSSLPLFFHIGSHFGRFHFWRGKWTPNQKIQVVPEIRLTKISNELFCTYFGLWEAFQNWPGKSATHSISGATHRRKICQFCLFVQNFAQFAISLTFSSLLVN